MKLETLLRLLARAERNLKLDGLFIRLQSDGSGSVCTFAGVSGGAEERDVFRFADDAEGNLAALVEWLKAPRIVEYDEEGAAKGAGT